MKMEPCQADFVKKILSWGFGNLGRLIARYPWWFIIVPVGLSMGLGVGFCFLERRQTNNFLSAWGPSKREMDLISTHFPMNETEHFSAQRLYTKGSFASLIVVSLSHNILDHSNLEDLHRLDRAVKGLNLGPELSFQQLCVQVNGSMCYPANPLLAFMPNGTDQTNISYPLFENRTFLGKYIGGVTLGPGSTVLQAKALRLVYYLREDNNRDEANNIRWLSHFINSIPQQIEILHWKYFQVYYYTSVSLQNELEEDKKKVVPFYIIMFIVTVLFSLLSCARLHNVRNKIWVAVLGALSPGLAILSSFGLLLLCGVPFAAVNVNAPFLILGVAVDNTFIIFSCWQQTKVTATLEERMAETYQEAALSIAITTLIDVLAFYIGINTNFPSVQSFCIYIGTALVFCYLYCITFFGAVLVLNGICENDNRHWLMCLKVNDTEEPGHKTVYQTCCLYGPFKTSSGTEIEHPITMFFQKYYGPFLTNRWTKLMTLISYIGYLAFSIYGCLQIQGVFNLQKVLDEDSYVTQYHNKEALYFTAYGPRIMVVVISTESYWEPETQNEIETCLQMLENNSYIDKRFSESWLRTYENMSKTLPINITNQDDFMNNLNVIYLYYPDFKQDINREGNTIKGSRFFIQSVNLLSIIDERNMVNRLRTIAATCKIPLMVYHPLFLYVDKYFLVIQSAVQNLIVDVVVMFVVTLLFIPNLLCSLWVTFAIASIIVGVTGFMAYWKFSLDSISLITLVVYIGFSVDSSTHIAYAFFSSKKSDPDESVVDALHFLGYPTVQGALSTVLGVVALSTSDSYIFKMFNKVTCIVVAFGALHGLVFIPAFLSMIGRPKLSCCIKTKPEHVNSQQVGTLTGTTLNKVQSIVGENQIKAMQVWAKPSYVSSVSSVPNTDITFTNYFYKDWQSDIFSIFQSENSLQKDENENRKCQYRNRMIHLHLEARTDPDCS